MNIVVLGGPGSGKKTQTSLLADNYNLTVVTTGELVKRALEEESERGLQLCQQQQAGQQVPDDIMLTLLQERLRQSDLGSGFILDGFPRNLLQALTLDELLGEMGLSLDFVLLFEIETDALMERLVGRRTCRSCKAVYNVYTQPTVVEDVCDLCGGKLHQRADDTEETVSNRLHVFDHLTAPLLSHYGKQGKVVRVDGEGEVDVVFARTRQAIDRFLVEQAETGAVAEQQPALDPVATVAGEVTPDPIVADEAAAKAAADDAVATAKKPETELSGQKRPAERAGAVKSNSAGSAKKAKPQPAATKKKAAKKVAGGQKKAVVKKKGAAGKVAKRTTTPARAGGKKSSRKPAVKKKALAKEKAAKRVVSKQTVKRKSAAGKPTEKKRVAKKVTEKQAAKKRVASVKSKPLTKKKATTKKTAPKRAVTKKPVPKKAAAAKPKSKKKPLAKPTTLKKHVKKQATKKSAKRSST